MTNHSTHHPGAHSQDEPGTHGMLIVGEETIYLSHLPMFHPRHDDQAILEVTFSQEGSDPQTVYVNDRKKTGGKIYTFVPEKFVLSDLVSTHPHHPSRRSFNGTIVRGHFERVGKPITGDDVVANVTKVVHFRKFDPHAEDLPQLEYLLFGKGEELFLSHLITKKPDFEQILSVKIDGHGFTDEELRHGVRVIFPGRANSVDKRIREGEQVLGKFQVAGEKAPETGEVQVTADVEFYFDRDDINM